MQIFRFDNVYFFAKEKTWCLIQASDEMSEMLHLWPDQTWCGRSYDGQTSLKPKPEQDLERGAAQREVIITTDGPEAILILF